MVCRQFSSIAAIDVDEDGIALNDFGVGTSEWLRYWIEAMVIVDHELAIRQTSTVSYDVSYQRQVRSPPPASFYAWLSTYQEPCMTGRKIEQPHRH